MTQIAIYPGTDAPFGSKEGAEVFIDRSTFRMNVKFKTEAGECIERDVEMNIPEMAVEDFEDNDELWPMEGLTYQFIDGTTAEGVYSLYLGLSDGTTILLGSNVGGGGTFAEIHVTDNTGASDFAGSVTLNKGLTVASGNISLQGAVTIGSGGALKNLVVNGQITATGLINGELNGNASGQKPTYVTYGGSAVGLKPVFYQSDLTAASANNPAVAGGAGVFTVVVADLVGKILMSVSADAAGSAATTPTLCSVVNFDSGTGTISGIASIWNAATQLWEACADGTRVRVKFIGVTPTP